MKTTAVALALLSTLVLSACTGPEPAVPDRSGPRPGYSDSVPSPEAQGRLRALWGKPVPVGVAGATEPGWTFSGFSVVPNEVAPGGKGPIVSMLRDGKMRHFFVPDDAAVDALIAEVARATAAR